jgi:lipopolysaccharide/colanic/teichoic acid biosynthesis glycosyltransferase
MNNLPVEKVLHRALEIMEFLEHFIFIFQQIYPYKLIIIVHKTYIVLVSTNGFGCRPSNVRTYKFKRMTRQTRGNRIWLKRKIGLSKNSLYNLKSRMC